MHTVNPQMKTGLYKANTPDLRVFYIEMHGEYFGRALYLIIKHSKHNHDFGVKE